MSTVTKSEFAREHSVSPTSVAKWIKRGLAIENGAGLIEREISNKNLAGRPIVYRGGKLGGTPKGGPWATNGHGDLRTEPEWEVELIGETLHRLKAVGKKLATEAEFVEVANAVLDEWRGDS
jgi:hypothetical protein